MKKLIYSLIALASLFTLASCQPDKLIDGGAYGEGTVNATFSVVLGPQTKAIADGTTVDKLYAGVYEVSGTDYTWVADNSSAPVAISAKAGTVTFNGKLELGKSYKMVFWAMKEGAPYAIDWAKNVTTGPTVTVTATGAANDETRDAFFGMYETGTVTGSIDLTGSPITLKRPFAQVNVLVPTANFVDASAAVTSSMTVAQAPTVLNLATKATSDPADWTLSAAAIDEAAFGTYSSTHKYVAMNYVLVDQIAADPRYDVTFSVTSGSQVASDKQVKNAPLKPNGRTNIVGNIFDANFNITVPFIIDPGANPNQELTQVTVAVGGMDENNAISLTDAYNQGNPLIIDVTLNHPVEVEADKPQITVTPASVATAEWVIGSGLKVTPLVADGKAVITLVFPAVTKTDYSSATVQIYIKVGNGKNPAAAPTFSPAAGEIPAGTAVVISSETEGATIHFTVDGSDPTSESQTYDSNSAGVVINEPLTLKAIAVKDGYSDSAISTAAYTIAAKPAQTLTIKVGEDAVGDSFGKIYGDNAFSLTVSGNEGNLSYTSGTESVATISNAGVISIIGAGSALITVTAEETNDYAETSKSFTLNVAKKASSITLTPATVSVTVGGTVEVGYTAVTDDGEISVSDNSTASAEVVPQSNKIVISGLVAGSTTLNVSITEGTNYAALTETQSIAVTVTKADRNLAFSPASAEVTIGANNNSFPTLSGDKIDDVVYSVENASPAGCVTINESTGKVSLVEAGTATIKATGAETPAYNSDVASYALTVNPAAIQNVTVAQFLAASVSETQKYRLTGIVGGTINVQYGNFDLTDDSGTVAIYGLFAEEVAYGTKNPGNNILTTLELGAGDRVTIVGYRGEHNGNPQAVYSYHESHVDALAAPANLVVGTTNDKKITATWDAVDGAASYTLKIGDTEIENATSPFTSASAYADGSYSVSVKAVGTSAPDSPYCTPEVVAVGSVVAFSWTKNGGVTDGFVFTPEKASSQTGYYQDKSGSEGLSLLIQKSGNSALFSSTPNSISLTVSVGGGSTKNPLSNNVIAYLVDSEGKNIDSTETIVTTKVEVKEGKEYTVTMPNVAEAYGVRITHEKETSYNLRVYGINFIVL